MPPQLFLYLDANAYLAFYAYSKDDLDQLGKLADLVKKSKISLLVPDQTHEEFRRNRDKKIAESIDALGGQRFRLQFPQICKDYPEYEDLRRLQRQFQETHSRLLDAIKADAAESRLKADAVIQRLFDRASKIPLTADILDRARLRMERGNPPGKKGMLGDGINWESLLTAVPGEQDLHFVSDDGDFASRLDENEFLPFLVDEWKTSKKSEVHFYRSLSAFFKVSLPQITLAEEQRRAVLISSLAASSSFAETHTIVRQLLGMPPFTPTEAEQILNAVVANDQVYWIISDADVKSLVRKVMSQHEESLSEELAESVARLFAEVGA